MPCFDVILDKKYQNSKLGSPTWFTVYKDNIIYFILEQNNRFWWANKWAKSVRICYFKTILFYHLKTYFIPYTIPFYNSSNISIFIFPYNTLK